MNRLTFLPSPNQGIGKALVRHFFWGREPVCGWAQGSASALDMELCHTPIHQLPGIL